MRTAIARLTPAARTVALGAAALVALSSPAGAQSFLQQLFGGGSSSPGQTGRPLVHPGTPAALQSFRSPRATHRETGRFSPAADHPRSERDDADGAQPSGTRYRTVCVRTCDGYYFPLGNSVPRARFMRDAAQCRASCGEDARLYYLPAGSDNMSTMLDLAGRSYLRMPNAFKYRKTLIDGCSCRPMPWSEAELGRHRRYAEDAARAALAQQFQADAAGALQPLSTAVAAVEEQAAGPSAGPADEASSATVTGVDAGARAPVVETPPRTARGRASSPAASLSAAPSPSARRQAAVARVTGGNSGGGLIGTSWLPTAGSTRYTWPGDAPRR